MVRKLFIYTGIVIWHFEKAKTKNKTKQKQKQKTKKTWNFNICNYFCGKMQFWAIFHCGNGIRQRINFYPENIINHNFVRYPNSMVWKLSVYVKIIVTYFCKPKTR